MLLAVAAGKGSRNVTKAAQKWSTTVKWPNERPTCNRCRCRCRCRCCMVVGDPDDSWELTPLCASCLRCEFILLLLVFTWCWPFLLDFCAFSYFFFCCRFCWCCHYLLSCAAIAFLALQWGPLLLLLLLMLLLLLLRPLLLFPIRSSFNSVFIYTCPCVCPLGVYFIIQYCFGFYDMSLRRGRHRRFSLCGYLYLCYEHAVVFLLQLLLEERVKCVLWFYMNFLEFLCTQHENLFRQEFCSAATAPHVLLPEF